MSVAERTVNAGARAPRVLIVEDSPSMRRFLTTLLVAAGFDCAEAAGGAQGLEMFLREPFDLVLSDLQMAGVNGYQLLAAITLLPPWRRRPVVLLSAEMDEPSIRSRPELRAAAAMLTKPVDPAELITTLRDVLPRPVTPDHA